MKKYNLQSGFTLIDLLVTIAVISFLSSILLISVVNVRIKGRNTFTAKAVDQYITSFQAYYNDYGRYPNTGAPDLNYYCIGAPACFVSGVWPTNAAINNALYPAYVAKLTNVSPKPLDIGFGAANSWQGLAYSCTQWTNSPCSSITLRWALEGWPKSCGYGASATQSGLNTFCQLTDFSY